MQGNEKSAGKSQKKSWFQGLQSEFRKIVWTDRSDSAQADHRGCVRVDRALRTDQRNGFIYSRRH